MHDLLTGAGLSKVVVDAYLQGRAKEFGMNADLNQADIDSILFGWIVSGTVSQLFKYSKIALINGS